MWLFSLIPFLLQALAIALDEGYFHIRRGLPKWERIGHPIDTLSVMLCMGFVLVVPFSTKSLIVYCVLAAFSCFLVTKDEFVHKTHCSGAENWLHAVLFILHPITLTFAGFIWPVSQGIESAFWLTTWLDSPAYLKLFLKGQCLFMSVFFVYQIIFWNFIWKDKPVLKL